MSEANASRPNDSDDVVDGAHDHNAARDQDTARDRDSARDQNESVSENLEAAVDEIATYSHLEKELEEANGRALRIQAELDNYRKRTRREMDEARRYAALPVIRDLLPVIDNFDRAIGSLESDQSNSGMLEGVKMVAEQLKSILRKHHCQPIHAEGATFEPSMHEAIAQEASDEHPEGTVIRTMQTGYRLHDRVIRPSQVVVSSGSGTGD